MLEYNADFNKMCIVSDLQITPLALFCEQNKLNLEAIQLLLDAGADVNIGDTTPLGFLLHQKKTNYEAINLLLDKGADINKEFTLKMNSIHYTPLSYLLQQKHPIKV